MHRTRVALVATLLSAVAGSLVVACGEDAAPIGSAETTSDAATSTTPDPEDDDPNKDDDPSDPDSPDGGKNTKEDAGGMCTNFAMPDLNGEGPCGTIAFGEPAAAFGPVDPNAGTTYSGTELADGVYDAVNAERASGNNGSWRETFVVKGNRFTRIRQIDTGLGNGPGPISYRAGTFAYEVSVGGEQMIKLTYDFAQTGDAGANPGPDTLPSDAVVSADCSARFRYGASGIRISLRRR